MRALVAFNEVDLADDEALQQDPNTTSAIRSAGQVFQVVLGQTDSFGEYSVLWHVPVVQERVPEVTAFWEFLSATESKDAGFQFDKDWETPLKRLRGLRDGMPEQERHSDAWHSGDVPMESVLAL
ncbi:unnamed protein product [Durusdinium trenchii]|uniref:Uncharacterized protein n=1 Tax=Durusdinium trenchii TaxID=1381693 RepID=A0ABP0SNM4_9DINO